MIRIRQAKAKSSKPPHPFQIGLRLNPPAAQTCVARKHGADAVELNNVLLQHSSSSIPPFPDKKHKSNCLSVQPTANAS